MKALQLNCDYVPKEKQNDLEYRKNYKGSVSKANLFYKNPVISYVEYEMPKLQSDEIKIRVKKVGLCGSDYHCINTNQDKYIQFSGPAKFPQVLGHEFCGIVEEVGDNVTLYKPGDYVTSESIIWCGSCINCRNGNFSECINAELIGLTKPGALTKYINVPQAQVWKINNMLEIYSEDILFDLATLFEPIGCAFKGIFFTNNIIFTGAIAAVYGAGPIGLSAAWLLKISGVSKIFIFDKNINRIKIARSLGFKNVLNISDYKCISEYLIKESKGYGIDISVECSGAANKLFPEIIKSKSTQGIIVYLSRTGNTKFNINFDSIISKNNFIVGSRGHSKTFNYIMNIFLNKDNSYILDMITKKIKFEDVKTFLDNRKFIEECKVIVEL